MKYLKLYESFRLILEDNKEKLSPEKFIIQPYPIDDKSDDDKNKPTLLLIPGGGGNPIEDYDVLAPLLKKTFNLITFSYDENVKDNGREKCKKIAEQLKSYPNLSILGFSMGTTFGFWIIKELGSDFKGKFICIDAAAPNAIAPDKYVSTTMKNNTMRRYNCVTFPFYEKDSQESTNPTKDEIIQFKYTYKPEVHKKNPSDFDFGKAQLSDFDFNQSDYETWRATKELVIEFIDEPFTEGVGEHYPSKMNPSSVWKKGVKQEEIPTNDGKPTIEYIKSIITLSGIKNPNNVWIVQDKYDSPDKKNYYCDIKNGDRKSNIDFLHSQAIGMVGSLQRDPKEIEKLDNNVECLIIRAGKTDSGTLTEKQAKEDDKRNFPNDKTSLEVIPGVEHHDICRNGASQISGIVNKFIL
jgi:hypothetical protein